MFDALAGLVPGNMIWGTAQGSGAGLPDPNALIEGGVQGDLPPLGASLSGPLAGPGPFVGPMPPTALSGGTNVPSDVAFGGPMNPPEPLSSSTGPIPQSEPAAGPPSPLGPPAGAGAVPGAAPPAAGGGAAPGSIGEKLLGALRGVVAPPAPIPQKVSTPGSGLGHAPAITPAHPQASKLFEVLSAMGLGRPAVPPLRPQASLGQSLGRG